MKKLIAMAFVGAFALAMLACGAKEEKKEETTTPETTAPADTTKTDTTKTDTTAVH